RQALGAAGGADEVAAAEVALGDDAGVGGADGGEADLDPGAFQLGPGDADLGLGVDDLRLALLDPRRRGRRLGAGGGDGGGGRVFGGDGGVALLGLLFEQAQFDGVGFAEVLDAQVGLLPVDLRGPGGLNGGFGLGDACLGCLLFGLVAFDLGL